MKKSTLLRGTLAYGLLGLLASCTPAVQKAPEVTPTPTTPTVDTVSGTITPTTPAIPTSTEATPSTPAAQPTGAVTPVEKPFAYSDTIEYSNPSGSDKVKFDVTIDKGIITALTVTPEATNKISEMKQEQFRDAAAKEIVGKPIAGLNVSAVGGASLTTGAFEEFIKAAEAKQQATK